MSARFTASRAEQETPVGSWRFFYLGVAFASGRTGWFRGGRHNVEGSRTAPIMTDLARLEEENHLVREENRRLRAELLRAREDLEHERERLRDALSDVAELRGER